MQEIDAFWSAFKLEALVFEMVFEFRNIDPYVKKTTDKATYRGYVTHPRSKAWQPASLMKSTKIVLVIFGNIIFGTNNSRHFKGKSHGIVHMTHGKPKRREAARELIVIKIDEYLSFPSSIGIWNMKSHMVIVLMANHFYAQIKLFCCLTQISVSSYAKLSQYTYSTTSSKEIFHCVLYYTSRYMFKL
jgi:hypothetical protein